MNHMVGEIWWPYAEWEKEEKSVGEFVNFTSAVGEIDHFHAPGE